MKAATGIVRLDIATRGGLPRGRSTLVAGGAGSGKTVLASLLSGNFAEGVGYRTDKEGENGF